MSFKITGKMSCILEGYARKGFNEVIFFASRWGSERIWTTFALVSFYFIRSPEEEAFRFAECADSLSDCDVC